MGKGLPHWVDKNSIKLHNEQNVLRAEMTMNNPGAYREFRRQDGNKHVEKKRMALRKGLADIPVHTQVAADITQRFMVHMATLQNMIPLGDVLKDVTHSSVQHGRTIRALDISDKDRESLPALADPKYVASSITSKILQQVLRTSLWAKDGTTKTAYRTHQPPASTSA